MSISTKTIYVEMRASADRLKADLSQVNASLATVGSAGKDAGAKVSTGMKDASESVGKIAKNATEAALAFEGFLKIAARYTAIASSSGSATEGLLNTFRALRVAMDPSMFTATSVAMGVLAEQTVKLTVARAKLLEQQSLISAVSGRSVTGIEGIRSVSSAAGSNEQSVQGLIDAMGKTKDSQGYKSGLSTLGITPTEADAMQWTDFLAKVATGFDSLKDPVDRARLAVQLFGKEHAGDALRELTPAFAAAAAAASEFGVTLNATSRQQIYAVRHDLLDLKNALLDFSKEKVWVDAVKTRTAEVAAAYYDMSKRGISALTSLIDKQTGLGGLGSLNDPGDLGAKERERKSSIATGETADDLFALAQGSAGRKSQTFAGKLKALQEAREQADDTYTALLLDQQKRQADPNDASLLTSDQRFALATRQQSSSALAGGLTSQIRGAKQAPDVIGNQIEANRQTSDSTRQKTDNEISLARLSSNAQIDAIEDVHERAIEGANADVTMAQDRLAKLKPLYSEELAARVALVQKRASAEGQMESPEDAGHAQIAAQREIADAKAETAAKITALEFAATEAQTRAGNTFVASQRGWTEEIQQNWMKMYDDIQKKAVETFAQQNLPDAYRTLASVQVGQINAKGKGVTDDLEVQRQKLDLERSYGLEVTHSAQEQVSYLTQVAGLNDKANMAKLRGLDADLRLAENEAAAVTGGEKEIEADSKVAELKQRIAQLSSEAQNSNIAAVTAIDQTNQKLTQQLTLQQQLKAIANAAGQTSQSNQQQIGKQLGQTLGNVPKDIGDDIGGAISTALLSKHPGKSIGQEMGDAMVQALKQTAASVLKSLISSGVQFGLGFLGFADGGDPPVGRTVMVGEHGPELIRLKSPGTVIPNHNLNAYLQRNSGMDFSQYSAPGLSRYPNLPSARGFSGAGPTPSSSSSGGHTFHNTFHIYDASDPQEVARTMADYLQLAVANTTKFSR